MRDSFVPDFPNILEAGTTNMNQFHDTAAPPPMPLPQAQALHDMLHDHVNVLRAQLQIAEKARDNEAALVSSMQEPAAQYTTSHYYTTTSPHNSQDTKYGIAFLRNNRGVLTIMNEKPNKVVVDSGAIKTMIGRLTETKLGITPRMLKPEIPYITACGAHKLSLGSTK